MPPVRLLALALVAAVLAGCIDERQGTIDEGVHVERPPEGKGYIKLDMKRMSLQVSTPNGTREDVVDVRGGNFTDGVFVIVTDRLTLRFRIDEPLPVGLAFDEDLSLTNSFTFAYHETPDVAGRTITQVGNVSNASRLEITTWDPAAQDTAGFIRFHFEGWCDAGDDGCADPSARHAITLTGKFPKRLYGAGA